MQRAASATSERKISGNAQQHRITSIHWSALLIVRSRGQRRNRASLDCLMHGPRSGRDACVMAEGGARLTWMGISPANRITNDRCL